MKKVFAILVIIFLLSALGILGYRYSAQYQFHGSVLQEPKLAAEIVLRADSRPVRLSNYRGKITLLYFGYTFCPDVCPTSLANLKLMMGDLSPEEAAQVQVIFISVDPNRDTPEKLGQYVQLFDSSFIGATGTREEIDLITSAFNIYYKINSESKDNYSVDHSGFITVIDRSGYVIMNWQHGTPPSDMSADLRYLLKNGMPISAQILAGATYTPVVCAVTLAPAHVQGGEWLYQHYRFRADYNGTQFWSGVNNHCDVPGCSSAGVTVTTPVTVTVEDTDGAAKAGLKVYAFNGSTYAGYNGTTDANGQVTLILQQGNYHFRADYNGIQYWSAASNHCTVPGCPSLTVIVDPQPTATATTIPPTTSATPIQTETPLPTTATPAPTETASPTTIPTDTEISTPTETPTETPLARLPGNVFAVSFVQPWSHVVKANAAPAQYDNIIIDEFDSPVLDPAWDWVEPLDGPSWSLTNTPGFFQFTVPTGYEHWEGVNDAPSLRRTDMGAGNFAIETRVDQITENEPGDGYKFGLVVGFSETDRLWMSITGDGQLKTQRTGVEDTNIGLTTLPVFLRIEKIGSEYAFLYKQNAEDTWTSLASYTASPVVSYVGMYGSTYIAASDVTYSVDYFRLERTASADVTVTVSNTDGVPQEGVMVYAFNSAIYAGYNGITDANGQIAFPLPDGSYRFRADLNGTQFWSGGTNHCVMPGCNRVGITVTQYNSAGLDEFDSTTLDSAWTWVEPLAGPSWSLTNNPGFFQFTLPPGHDEETNTAPSLQRTDVGTGDFIIETSYSIENASGWYEPGLSGLMVGFSETDRIWIGFAGWRQLQTNTDAFISDISETGIDSSIPIFLRIEKNGAEYTFLYKHNAEDVWIKAEDTYTNSAVVRYVGIFGDSSSTEGDMTYNVDYFRFENTIPSANVTAAVLNTDGTPQAGASVYVFDDTPSTLDPVYTGFNGVTDADGLVSFNLPVGSYRFRADLNGTQFWNDEADQCSVLGCKQVEITVSKPVTVTVLDSASTPKEGLKVYAFDGTRYTGYNGTTNANGQAILTLPEGSYRFRADLNGTQFWSATENSCAIPGCENAAVTVSLPVTVTVLDTDSTPKVGLNVYAFDETTYSGYHLATDANGQVIFTLLQGNYRFRADLNGTQFWSGSMNHCDPNNVCAAPVITVTKPVTVTVLDAVNVLYPNLSVYAFDGTTYTGYHGTTDAKGQVTLTLPQGNYRFRADYNGTQFWSATENNCTLPGCENTAVTLPGGFIKNEVTIDYTYDPLYRLTTADYSNGDAYRYAYDSVGNRLMQESMVKGLTSNVDYQYDIANRLADVDGVPYVYDNNGNLLNNGVNEYVYDPANRLTTVNSPSSTVSYGYNGLGDRLSQNEVNYTLDLNTGLTQVLSDGTTTYTYGLGRISQQSGSTPEYFLGDALGSVRQLTSQSGAVTYAASYDPYGVVTQSGGASNTEYGFTGEATSGDSTQLIYLRARWYNPSDSRFQSRDTWEGTSKNPMSMNHWNYTQSNPINYTDPSGYIAEKNAKEANEIVYDLSTYNVFISVDWGEIYVGENWDQCWHEGQWTMPDLKAIQAAVHIMDKGVRYLGGDFKKLIGFVKYEPQKGGPDGKGDPANNYLATTTLGQTVWQIANWDSEENRLWVAVHEMGHIVAFNDMPDKVKYFRDELGASCSNGKNYCNTNEDHTLTYKPGSFAGDKNQNMPSSYALIGSYEDFAETWREVVTSAYIRSGDTTYIRQAWLVYNSNYYKLNHDIGRRRKVMNSIINGSWR